MARKAIDIDIRIETGKEDTADILRVDWRIQRWQTQKPVMRLATPMFLRMFVEVSKSQIETSILFQRMVKGCLQVICRPYGLC